MPSRLLLPVAVLPLVLLAPACREEPAGAPANSPNAEARRTPVAAVELTRRDLSRQLVTSGAVEPRVRTRLASRTAGHVEGVTVEEGDAVERGQVLARLDTTESLAELARARAEEERASQEYARVAELREQRIASPAEYGTARAAMLVAESERQIWETRVAFGRIVSPHDAVVTARYIEPGESVDTHEALFELASMNELVVRLAVSELDVVHLDRGQPVPLRFDARPDIELEGVIRRIAPTADPDSRLITVEVLLPEDALDHGIRAGFLARVRIAIDRRPDVLAVLTAAIGERDDERYVYVIRDDRLHWRVIELGATRGQWTEVLEGLEPGEIVLATNPIDMRDGQPVRIVGWRG